jgi:TonB family protein
VTPTVNVITVQTPIARIFLQSLACVALLLPLSAQSAAADHGNLIRSNSAIVARIASDRLVYHLGDPIRVRLTLTNKSTDQLYIGHSPPPFALVDLQLLDLSGRPLPHGGTPSIRCMNGRLQMLSWNLSPGKPVVIGFYDPENHWQHTDWADVKCWGYRVNEPGSYRLIATPQIEAFGPGDEFNDAPAQESNEIRIRVTRGLAGPLLHYAAAPNPACPHPNAEATITDQVSAQYPARAYNSGFRSATVEVEVTVGPSGNLVDAGVIKSSGNLSIDEAALRAARQSTYSPKLVECNPVQGNYLFRAKVQPR